MNEQTTAKLNDNARCVSEIGLIQFERAFVGFWVQSTPTIHPESDGRTFGVNEFMDACDGVIWSIHQRETEDEMREDEHHQWLFDQNMLHKHQNNVKNFFSCSTRAVVAEWEDWRDGEGFDGRIEAAKVREHANVSLDVHCAATANELNWFIMYICFTIVVRVRRELTYVTVTAHKENAKEWIYSHFFFTSSRLSILSNFDSAYHWIPHFSFLGTCTSTTAAYSGRTETVQQCAKCEKKLTRKQQQQRRRQRQRVKSMQTNGIANFSWTFQARAHTANTLSLSESVCVSSLMKMKRRKECWKNWDTAALCYSYTTEQNVNE